MHSFIDHLFEFGWGWCTGEGPSVDVAGRGLGDSERIRLVNIRFDARKGALGIDASGELHIIDFRFRAEVQKYVSTMTGVNGLLILENDSAKGYVFGGVDLISALRGDGPGKSPIMYIDERELLEYDP